MYDALHSWETLVEEERGSGRGIAPGKVTLTGAIQRKAAAGRPAAPVEGAASATGMPAAVQAKMEAAFDFDFSAVRIHEGAEAAAVGARAFTRGVDIHFAPGEYAPHAPAGQELLGHELAHVVQQAGGRVAATTQAKGVALNDDDALEREADEQGARAARGEYVGAGRGGGAVAGAVVQRARTGKKQVATKVSGYPTMEGEDADRDDIPFSDRCFAVIVKGIIPALEVLGSDALKEDPRDGQSTGFMIGVALTSDGQLVGATSGAAPDAVLDVLRQFCDRTVRSNVQRDAANEFIEDEDDARRDAKLGRYQIANHNETGGMAGFCAAFKILYANPMLTFVGMAEVVYAPTAKPQPKIASADGTVVTYEHGDAAPSCATCRKALHGLLQRGRDMRAPKPRKGISGPTAQELLAKARHDMSGYAEYLPQIPDALLKLLGGLSDKQRGAAGKLLAKLGAELAEPMRLAAEFIGQDLDMLANDRHLLNLLKTVNDSMADVSRLLSMSVNDGTKEERTGVEGLLRSYVQNLEALARGTSALVAYVDSLRVEDDGGGGAPSSGTLGSMLPKDTEQDVAEAVARWRDLELPGDIAEVSFAMLNMERKGVVDLYDQDNALWFLDLATGKLTRDQASDDERDEASDRDERSDEEDPEFELAAQENFTVAVGAICTYMQVNNASGRRNNCLIHSIGDAAGVAVTAEHIRTIRQRAGDADGYLGTASIPDIVDVLGVARPICVIATMGHGGGNRFAVEDVGDGANPIYVINANDIHFGWGTVKGEFQVERPEVEDAIVIDFAAAAH